MKQIHNKLKSNRDVRFETVSHGNSWSIYIRDPEGNRVDVFTDTPWHVAQPVRFEIDLNLPDEMLLQRTEDAIRNRPGFGPSEAWRKRHRDRFLAHAFDG